MGAFQFFRDKLNDLVGGSVDRKMQQTANVIEQTLIPRIHVISGYLKSTSGVTYRQSDKTIMLHFDAPYAVYEFGRGGTHDPVNPALQAGAKLWGGNFEVHFPNTSVGKKPTSLSRMRQAEVRIHSALGGGRKGLGSRTTIHSRRWHKHHPEFPTDACQPIL